MGFLPRKQLRKEVNKLRKELWDVQKSSEAKRVGWLEKIAQDRARAINDPDWKKKLESMAANTQNVATNRKLSAVLKGRRGGVISVSIPTHDWFFSPKNNSLYHYTNGVFEAHPAADDGSFYPHHTLRVFPEDYELVRVSQDTNSHWVINQVLIDPGNVWVRVTSGEDIHRILLERNKRHLQQTSMEGGSSNQEPFLSLRENYGVNDMSRQLLEGTYESETELTPEVAAYFKALERTPSERDCPVVDGWMTSADFQQMFKVAKEKTSSESTTPNYTIWKAMSKSNYLSSFMGIMLSLPFVYGFPNPKWCNMTDFMLQKKPGNDQIHTHRIIGKLAAEFNTCLKFIMAKKLANNYENNNPSPDQFGGRPHRSSVDAAMLKLLTFESARMMKAHIASMQIDLTAHYDRILKEHAGIHAMKNNVTEEVVISINMTIDQLKRRVETVHGISKDYYQQNSGEPQMGGMVQGKADVPTLSNQQCDIQMKVHKSIAPGLTIHSPDPSRKIEHHLPTFVDDSDAHVSSSKGASNPHRDSARKLESSAQTLNDIIEFGAGLFAMHKMNWQATAWEMVKGHMELIQATTERIVLKNNSGGIYIIEWKSPDEPNIGLGYYLCPSGNQKPHFEATYKAVQKLCRSAAGAFLNEAETRQALFQRLVPKLSYALKLTSFNKKQFGKLNSLLRQTFVPGSKLNRNLPSAVLYGMIEHGGMEYPECQLLQDQVQIPYVLQQLRWDKEIANAMLTTINTVQLNSGLVFPLLEFPATKIDYMGNSFILDLRCRLLSLGGSMWIENAWTPKLQREGDSSIMQLFIDCPLITRAMRKKACSCLMYMRCITLADIADPTGKYIPDGMLTGKFQAGSDFEWPDQMRPPKKFWAAFRKCLILTVCRRTSPYKPAEWGMDLDEPLGKWLAVKRNVWWSCYKAADYIYWRGANDDKLVAMKPSGTPGFYVTSHEVEAVPLDSHPINHQQVGEKVWTRRPHRIAALPLEEVLPSGHIVENTISNPETEHLVTASDGSLYLHEQVATCAWLNSAGDDEQVSACFLLANISSLSSYRVELEGIFRSLRHIGELGMTPREVAQWCDNLSAVESSNNPIFSPRGMLLPDADVILAIHHLKSRLPFLVNCRHVYGHQDTRKKKADKKEKTTGMVIENPLEQQATAEAKQVTTQPDSDDIESLPDDNNNSFSDESAISELFPCFAQPAVSTTRNPYIKQPQPQPKLTRQAKLNIVCDKVAEETALHAIDNNQHHPWVPPALSPPYEGSRAMLKIGTTWITSNYKQHILRARRTDPMRIYCEEQYGWSHEDFDSIYWKSVRQVRRKMTHHKSTQVCKYMHGWLPNNHMRQWITGISQCPNCTCRDETLDHMLRCPNHQMKVKRKEMIAAFRKKGLAAKIPRRIILPFCEVLETYLHSRNNYISPTYIPSIKKAIRQQLTIGIKFLARGFIVTDWFEAIKATGVQHPDRKMVALQRLIWSDIFEPAWKTRNELAHAKLSKSQAVADEALGERIYWYTQHKHDVLPIHNHFLARHDWHSIQAMNSRQRRAWITHLDVAREAYANERKHRASNQSVITRFLVREPTIVGEIASTATRDERPLTKSTPS